jgi:predicted helicase
MREARGVYYTPEPVVSYIVRSIDLILKRDFGLKEGLADATKIKVEKPDGPDSETHKVQILDPAAGTGTFLYYVIDLIRQSFTGKEGMWPGYVSEQLLPRLFGFELLMAPYAVAHMKLGIKLDETGYDFASDERLRLYLTNTLERAFSGDPSLPFANWIAEEANAAGSVKRDAPVMVVLGNPPYSGHSANAGEWISKLLRGEDIVSGTKTGNYFYVDGKPLGERNPKWLNDDYVKFIRFAQWRIERTGYGVLGFISNHGYLDNPTFRGMRQSLMETFDDIYIIDLHGNSKRKEKAPDGGPDNNVFDIQQGVAIGIFVKKRAGKEGLTAVRHFDVYGKRAGKYDWLLESDIENTGWTELEPRTPYYLFVPQNVSLFSEYETGWKVTDAMPVNSVGFVTSRDHFVIDFDKAALKKRIEDFLDPANSDDEVRRRYFGDKGSGKNLPGDNASWKMADKRKTLQRKKKLYSHLTRCLYRPFDVRQIIFHDDLLERSRMEVMRHMIEGDNLGMCTNRQVNEGFRHIYCTEFIIDDCSVSLATRERTYLFPLYTYPSTDKKDLFDEPEKLTDTPGGRRPNLDPKFIEELTGKIKLKFIPDGKGDLKKTFGPEDIFAYMYAVFHSPAYRQRYAEFLKMDFPRLPLTSDKGLFTMLSALGYGLIELHLMEEEGEDMPGYPVKGDSIVDKVSYTEPKGDEKGKVYINKTQYFEDVPPEVWNFQIGGYQVCNKWLKDRKGRELTYDDIEHYRKIVAALGDTVGIMSAIDDAIERHGGWPIK